MRNRHLRAAGGIATLPAMRALLLVSTLLLTACASVPVASGGGESSEEAKLFADFLAGTYASNVEDASARASYYSRAFARAPEDPFIGRRALTFALLDGDLASARAVATDLARVDAAEPMARLVLGERAFARGRPGEARRYFAGETADFTMGVAMRLLDGWAALEESGLAEAVASFERLDEPGLEPLRELQIVAATLSAGDGDLESLLPRLDLVEESGLFGTEAALARADVLSRLGRSDEALAFLRETADEANNSESGPLANRISALETGTGVTDPVSPREGAASALTAPAFAVFARAGRVDAAEVYLRLALDLDPGNDLAKILLGSLLETSERGDEALALYRSIPDTSDYLVSARLAESNVLFDREADADALAVLEDVARAKPTVITREALGRARLIRENYAEALPIYDALVNSLSEEQLRADTTPLFLRGVANVELDKFPDAVRDFRRVLELDPDNAEALNYLGYSWVDRGENLREAFDMIERAVELEPDSGAITDSLGWAHYKLGNYPEARRHLERAAELSPSSATIIDHLGDVYWKLGRFREAGYQWRRALDLDPTEEEETTIRQKLRSGLDGTSALAAPSAAP